MARILVVEDNPANARLAAFILERAGHSLVFATTGEEGLQRARDELPDVVLMDIHLPGLDGLEATRRLKADARTRPIKVLALTAFAMSGDGQKIIDAGCDGYLAKPYPHHELLARIAGLLAPGPGT
jgi:two-component system cell cycle response regulator DivK